MLQQDRPSNAVEEENEQSFKYSDEPGPGGASANMDINSKLQGQETTLSWEFTRTPTAAHIMKDLGTFATVCARTQVCCQWRNMLQITTATGQPQSGEARVVQHPLREANVQASETPPNQLGDHEDLQQTSSLFRLASTSTPGHKLASPSENNWS